jgi:hypothetical protein
MRSMLMPSLSHHTDSLDRLNNHIFGSHSPDGDKAGRSAGAVIAKRLVAKLSTRLIEVPDGSQPDQMGADQIRCMCIPGYF